MASASTSHSLVRSAWKSFTRGSPKPLTSDLRPSPVPASSQSSFRLLNLWLEFPHGNRSRLLTVSVCDTSVGTGVQSHCWGDPSTHHISGLAGQQTRAGSPVFRRAQDRRGLPGCPLSVRGRPSGASHGRPHACAPVGNARDSAKILAWRVFFCGPTRDRFWSHCRGGS